MLAYTQRFLALAELIRSLHKGYREKENPLLLKQIHNLRFRIRLIRNMQWLGVLSLISCTVCLFFIFLDMQRGAEIAFGVSLALLITSLGFSAVEIQNSVRALDLHLTDLEEHREKRD